MAVYGTDLGADESHLHGGGEHYLHIASTGGHTV